MNYKTINCIYFLITICLGFYMAFIMKIPYDTVILCLFMSLMFGVFLKIVKYDPLKEEQKPENEEPVRNEIQSKNKINFIKRFLFTIFVISATLYLHLKMGVSANTSLLFSGLFSLVFGVALKIFPLRRIKPPKKE